MTTGEAVGIAVGPAALVLGFAMAGGFRGAGCWFRGHEWRRKGALHFDGFRHAPFMRCQRCGQTATLDSVNLAAPRRAGR